jgi:cardiolipin synthase
VTTPILTVANQLTILRMALTPPLILLVLSGRFRWALIAFLVAAATDLLDGLIARFGNQKTTLGAMLDPVADKLLVSSLSIALTWGDRVPDRIPAWVTVTTLSRDAIIVVSVVVINLAIGRRVFMPSVLGKLCTIAQLATVGAVILVNAMRQGAENLAPLYWITVFLTTASAIHYVYLASARRAGRIV